MRDSTIRLGRLSIHYRVAGNDRSPALVFLHGGGQEASTWDRVATAMAGSFRVIALDQRGHGRSDWPGEYSFELLRDDLAVFQDALGLNRFSLIGHSMGGTVAYLYAESSPDRLERLVIEETLAPGAPFNIDQAAETSVARRQFDVRLTKQLGGQLAAPDPLSWDRLSAITAPTLLVSGGSTSFIPLDQQEAVAKRIPNCKITILEGAGHHPHESRSAEFIDALRKFLL